jgi:hypothetical protein
MMARFGFRPAEWSAVVSICALSFVFSAGVVPDDPKEQWRRMSGITPLTYACARASGPIQIDGRPDDPAWEHAPWSEPFVDIEGDSRPRPTWETRFRMLWDDEHLYVLARLEEPHAWATLTERNSIIYNDNDFEIFLDPDGDGHNYWEYEVNALGTILELTLPRPYKDGGRYQLGTALQGLQSAVWVDGTLNDPSDTDRAWWVEVAIPFRGLSPWRGGRDDPPQVGEAWRINFSRVQWAYTIEAGKYVKVPKSRRDEDNWVWSPIGLIDMHRPERWGLLRFVADPSQRAEPDPCQSARDRLMELYYAQRAWKRANGTFSNRLEELALPGDAINLRTTDDGYVATLSVETPSGIRRISVDHHARIGLADP